MKIQTIKEIRELLTGVENFEDPVIDQLLKDERKGVQLLLERWRKEKVKARAQKQKFEEMSQYENHARLEGFGLIAGIDEAGRGPLAGPVVAASVILQEETYIPGLDDSKKLSAKKRDAIFDRIMEEAVAVGIGIISADEIDRINIYQAAKKAMMAAVQDMEFQPDLLLIDAMELGSMYAEQSLIKGDAKSVSIAAASIVAKVTRDRMMLHFHELYPQYGFDKHMGYGTKEHLEKISTFGPCPIHRLTFAPLKSTE